MYFRPLPAATLTITVPKEFSATSPTVVWPTGQAAISAEGYDFLYANQPNAVVSTASIAKVITALCVLEKKPLSRGERGPVLTMTSEDVARYQAELARDGTTLAVSAGDQLTEYEMLEAILLPSANNIADSAAIWAFGSLDAYRSYAQSYVQEHGMNATVIGPDASGYDPSTTSTPSDLVKLAKLALKNTVIMEIAGKPTATIEGSVQLTNHNSLVGENGITGLKTGRNDDNSGGLLFTATIGKGATTVNLAGIVADAGSLAGALAQSARLINSVTDDFPVTTIAPATAPVGTVRTAWGSKANIAAASDLKIQHWTGSTVYSYSELRHVSGIKKEDVGILHAKTDGKSASAKLKIITPASGPSTFWRLTHVR